MTTPPNPPEGSDNPYGGPPPPPGQNPYGATPYTGGDAYGGGQPAPAKTDGISIAAFVTGLLCLGPISLILGIVGITRTKNSQRKGRWAAVIGVVLGLVGLVTWIAVVAGGVWLFNNAVTPGNAEVGQCVNIDTEDNEVTMLKKECNEDHDGEIVGVAEVDDDNRDAIQSGMAAYCLEIVDEDDVATLVSNDEIELLAVTEDPSDVSNGDHLVCYAEAKEGKLKEKLLK